MIEHQIAGRGIRDPAVLRALSAVPRERFVPAALGELAYEDRPLPIGADQTISQPFIVAQMTEALELRPDDRVLEIGAGSGYGAAVLGQIAGEVYTIERLAPLAKIAAERLRSLGYHNVHVEQGDGTLGLAAHAPYDAISVTALAPQVPDALLRQLSVGGRMVIPVGSPLEQRLVRVRRLGADDFSQEDLGAVVFVPLIGQQGWNGHGRQQGPWSTRPGSQVRLR